MARAIGQEVQENSQVADSLVSLCFELFHLAAGKVVSVNLVDNLLSMK